MGLADFRLPALIGAGFSIPFAVLEFSFRILVRPDPRIVSPTFVVGLVVLFGFLWLLPFLSAVLGQRVMAEVVTQPRRLPLRTVVAKVVLMIGLAVLWGALVIDQLPCFLAVPNCD